MKDIKTEIQKLYQKLQDEAGFKVGDKVKITQEAKIYECGWQNSWSESNMTPCIGKTGKVTFIGADGQGIDVSVDGKMSWGYPYFVLEKVEETYHIGQRFLYNDSQEYILARTEPYTINFINLKTGGRWSRNQKVNNDRKITETEMESLADSFGQWKGFKVKEK